MDISQITQMFEHINVAILASDANFKVIYQNEKCKQFFEKEFEKADYIGSDIAECHPAEATKKVKNYFKEYEKKSRQLDYYVIDEQAGKVTVVNVPFYVGETFKGVVEFVFDSSLA